MESVDYTLELMKSFKKMYFLLVDTMEDVNYVYGFSVSKKKETCFMLQVCLFILGIILALSKCCSLYCIPNIIMVYPFSSCFCKHRQLSNQEAMFFMHLQFRILQFVYFSCGFVGLRNEDEAKSTFKTNTKGDG